MRLPLKGKTKITSPFGPRIHPISKKKSHHNGVDLIAYDDDTIYAPIAGRITAARKSNAPGGGYGHYVKMTDTDGNEHIFAHMKAGSIEVKTGDRVKAGDKLGIMGATGNVTGKHLHWEVRVKGKFTDPMDHLDKEPAPKPKPVVPRVVIPELVEQAKEQPKDEWLTHTVKRGDTAWGLSRRYGVSVADIGKWNKLSNASGIRVGQKLRIKR